MKENKYQIHVISELGRLLPGCTVLKNDSEYMQGVPDLIVLWNQCWAMLEVKKSADEPYQPNQKYYIDMFAEMSFAACIYPENEREVLDALQRQFQTGRKARIPKREQEQLG